MQTGEWLLGMDCTTISMQAFEKVVSVLGEGVSIRHPIRIVSRVQHRVFGH